jgi:predicted alpha/beta hydrolase family esterase
MGKNFDDYPIETLNAASLIIQAKDDKMADYRQIEQSVARFPNHTFLLLEKGGHLLSGNNIDQAFNLFISQNKVK